jgi:hypothetical protein
MARDYSKPNGFNRKQLSDAQGRTDRLYRQRTPRSALAQALDPIVGRVDGARTLLGELADFFRGTGDTIGMVFRHQLTVGLVDMRVAGIGRDTECGVRVIGRGTVGRTRIAAGQRQPARIESMPEQRAHDETERVARDRETQHATDDFTDDSHEDRFYLDRSESAFEIRTRRAFRGKSGEPQDSRLRNLEGAIPLPAIRYCCSPRLQFRPSRIFFSSK